jgi:hypothetical protein
MIRINVAIAFLVFSLAALCSKATAQTERGQSNIRRLVLVVGANDGGQGRTTLRYAGTDASRVAKLTRELGGVAARDIMRIDDSRLSSLQSALADLEARLSAAKAPGVRVEFLFYYSGHSDETGLLLGGERYSYKTLRDRIEAMPAEVKIAILDSCASGAFTRTKGGTKRPAFLVDESSQVNGYALIASSSATELAQESDRIASSFFTHYFVSGLRGGADANRDGRVTLNEAYQYAFDETVSRTESTQAGAQHPAYNMHLAGTGDVVMTDLRSTSASLVVASDIIGRLFIRDSQGNLVIELTKKQRHAITLGLAADRYSIVLLVDGRLARANIALRTGKQTTLEANHFARFKGERTVARGGHAEASSPSPVENQYFGASLLPSISMGGSRVRRNLSINLLGGSIAELHGLEVGAGVNHVTDSVRGLQVAGLVNASQGNVVGVQLGGLANVNTAPTKGLQVAGILNTSARVNVGSQIAGVANLHTGAMRGLQIAGVLNHNQQHALGVQTAGISNYAGSVRGIQMAGIANYSHGNTSGYQIAGIGNRTQNLTGAQVGGIASIATAVRGAQISGVANYAESVSGLQVSPLNISTGNVNGVQIGVVNVAKDSDVSIGILNIVENGHRALEAWTSDTSPIALGYKMGARRTYTTFSFAQSFTNKPLLGLGFGVHTPREGYYVDIDLLAFNRFDVWEDTAEDENDILAKLRLTIGWQVHRDVSLIGGLTLNTTHAFEKEGQDQGLVHREYRSPDYVLRYGPGAFVGAAWNLQ